VCVRVDILCKYSGMLISDVTVGGRSCVCVCVCVDILSKFSGMLDGLRKFGDTLIRAFNKVKQVFMVVCKHLSLAHSSSLLPCYCGLLLPLFRGLCVCVCVVLKRLNQSKRRFEHGVRARMGLAIQVQLLFRYSHSEFYVYSYT